MKNLAQVQAQADTKLWFTWYDSSESRRDVIHVVNPGPNSATIDLYVGGQKKTSGAVILPGAEWHVRYDGLIGGPVKIVSKYGQPITASKRTIWNEPTSSDSLEEVSSLSATSLFEASNQSTTWYFPWYDSSEGRKDIIMVTNPGPNYAQVEILIAGEKTPDSPYLVEKGEVWTPRYSNVLNGPVEVISLNEQPILVSKRVLWPDTRSFNETRGVPNQLADTVWWSPWYDSSDGNKNIIHVINPNSQAAKINIYVDGQLKTSGATVPGGGEYHIRYDGLKGGPLKVVSTNGKSVIVSQRVIWAGHSSFDETVAVPANQLDNTYWFPWYDSTDNRKNWIFVVNTGSKASLVEVYVDGNRTPDTPVTIPAGAEWHTRYTSLIGGPVKIVSTNGQPLLASQRVLWDGDGIFNEVMGVPQSLVDIEQSQTPLSLVSMGILDSAGNESLSVSNGDYLQLSLGADNQLGYWENTYWDMEILDTQGQKVSEMSSTNMALFIPTGLIGHQQSVTVPDDLPPGQYRFVGQIHNDKGVVSNVQTKSFEVVTTNSLFLPMIMR